MKEIMHIADEPVSSSVRGLFDTSQPLAIRCFAVLDGSIHGQIWTDDPTQPTWAAVQEAAFGTLFLGGQPSARVVHALIANLRQADDVALALWPDHPYLRLLPPAPDFDGWELEFTNGALPVDIDLSLSVPEGCKLQPIDTMWFERCRYRDYYAAYFGSAERTLAQGFGFCLVRGQELLAEAFAADAALGMIEIGTITGEAYQRQGYGALTCARLIQECNVRGYRTYWNCAKDNQASAGLARRLGYQIEREFRYLVWSPVDQ
jgi:RimJ/RimL family protein N-acetyltransferase